MTSLTKEDRTAEKPHGLERMIFFSDAVIAIMLTLLALELPVPHVDSATQLWHALAEHSAEYIAFLISFSVIAATWTAYYGRRETKEVLAQ